MSIIVKEHVIIKVEKMLKIYYSKFSKKEMLQYRVDIFNKNIASIERDLKETNIIINPNLKAIDYTLENSSNSLKSTSYIENEMIRKIDKLKSQLEYSKNKVLSNKARIRKIDEEIADIEYALKRINKEERKFIDFKYGNSETYLKISLKLNISETTARRKRKEILMKIANLLNID